MVRTNKAGSRPAAFSLLEMLAVMAVMLTLLVLVGVNVGSILRGGQLTQASQTLHDQLTLARQAALSSNRPVEVRLYRFADTDFPQEAGTSGYFRAVQLFAVHEDGPKPLGKLVKLPKSIIIDSGNELSPILGQATERASLPSLQTGEELELSLPAIGSDYHAAVFRFRPDGSTNLPSGSQWFLTVHEHKDGDTREEAPRNFATVQIDPVNGRARTFRP